MQALTQEQAAAVLGLTARRLRQLCHEENPPPLNSDGQFDPADFGLWLKSRDSGPAASYNADRNRLMKAQADKAELDVAETRGETARIPLIEMYWGSLVSAFRSRMLSIPTKCAAQIAAPDKLIEVTGILQSHIYEGLAELAGDGIPDEIRDRIAAQSIAADDKDSETPAEPDAKSVGERKADAKPRRQRGAGPLPG